MLPVMNDSPTKPTTARAVVALTALGVAGSAIMTLAHVGLGIPLVDAAGPGRLVVAAAAGFAVGTLLYAVVLVGAIRRARWTVVAGVIVNGLAVATASMPVRGPMSVAAIVVGVITIGVLVSPPGRRAFSAPTGDVG